MGRKVHVSGCRDNRVTDGHVTNPAAPITATGAALVGGR